MSYCRFYKKEVTPKDVNCVIKSKGLIDAPCCGECDYINDHVPDQD